MNSLEIEIRHAQDRLNSQLNNISGIRKQVYVNLLYYMLIVSSMILCAYVILADLYRTLKNHNRTNQRIRLRWQTNMFSSENHDDDYLYPTGEALNKNINNEIIKNLKRTNTDLTQNLANIKNFNKKINIDYAQHNQVDLRSLTNDDDYLYNPIKNNFWEMLFERPTFHSILNSNPLKSTPISYINFF